MGIPSRWSRAPAMREEIDTMPADKLCHYTRQPCMREGCAMWIYADGTDRNTGKAIRRYDCADALKVTLDLERNAQSREANAIMETMRAEHYLQMETVLVMAGRRDILDTYRVRRDHARALNRTDELLAERSGNVLPKALTR